MPTRGIDKVFANYASTVRAATYGYGAPTHQQQRMLHRRQPNCTGHTGSALDLTVGAWDKIYEGPYGYFRAGVQYEFIKRQLLPDGTGSAPSVNNHVIFTSLRYFPF